MLVALCVHLTVRAQYLLERKKVSDIKIYENAQLADMQKEQYVHISAGMFVGADPQADYCLLPFKRTADTFLPHCFAMYFFSPKDSIVHVALYEWDVRNEVTNPATQSYKFEQQADRLDDYTTQYKAVLNTVTALIGQPTQYMPITKTTDLTAAKSIWLRKNTTITLDMAFNNALQTVGTSKTGKYRVRLKVEYKAGE